MKDLLQKMKLPIIIIVIVGVGFVAYNSIFKKADDSGTLSDNTVADSSSAAFLPLLLQVQDIKFDQGFFNNSIYVSLKDFTQTIVPEVPGRDDPFSTAFGSNSASSSVEGLGFSVQTASAASGTSTAAETTTKVVAKRPAAKTK